MPSSIANSNSMFSSPSCVECPCPATTSSPKRGARLADSGDRDHPSVKKKVLPSGSWSQVARAPHGIASRGFVNVTPLSSSD